MSFDFNYKFWIATKRDLDRLIQRQNLLKKLRPIAKPLSFKLISELYVLYVEIGNKLAYCYSHTFQVQKRDIVRQLTDSVAKRLIELKEQLKSIELSEYVYADKALIERKLTPADLVIWRSPDFLFRRPPEVQNIICEHKIMATQTDRLAVEAKIKQQLGDAVKVIQAHERARQARVYKANISFDKKFLKPKSNNQVIYKFTFKAGQPMSVPVKRTIFNADFVKSSGSCQKLLNTDNLLIPKDDEIDPEKLAEIRNRAAIIIQTVWRGHKARKLAKSRRILRTSLYGMKTKRRIFNPKAAEESVVEMYQNELLKRRLDEDFINLINDERVRLLQQRSPWIMEDISDHIRAWFKEFYDKTGNFHPYPPSAQKGTVLVLLDETMDIEEFQESLNKKPMTKEEKKKQKEKERAEKKKQRAKIRKEKLKIAKKRKKMKAAGIIDLGAEIQENKHIMTMEETIKKYSEDWKLIDEYLNKNHEAIKDWVTQTELHTIHLEMRELVDQFMRIEYELLRKALCTDLKKKYKAQKDKKGKKGKGKKGKRKKGKDALKDRSLESLFEELKAVGIVEKLPPKSFRDFIAEFNFVADDTRDEDYLTTRPPTRGDIKAVIQDCMMGMGEFAVDKPKSILMIGPPNNGKKLLCNLIASELDAVVLNLSPERTVQFAENLSYFLNVLMKVALAFQPTILYIPDAHRVFYKKIPPEEDELQPRLLEKAIKKRILKPIKKTDRVMILGTSDIPWAAKGSLKKVFQKVILIPKSDYGTSFLMWLEKLEQNAGDNNMESYVASALSKTYQDYNTGDVTDNVNTTLDVRRRMQFQNQSLSPHEFEKYFLDREIPVFPPEPKILDKFQKWFDKSNKLAKERRKFLKLKASKDKKKK